MPAITNLIEPRVGKRILNHLIGNNCPEFCNELPEYLLFQTDLKKRLFGTLFLHSCFQNHPDSKILQKYQSRSADIPSLNLTPISTFLLNLGFVCSLLTVTTQKTNACSS